MRSVSSFASSARRASCRRRARARRQHRARRREFRLGDSPCVLRPSGRRQRAARTASERPSATRAWSSASPARAVARNVIATGVAQPLRELIEIGPPIAHVAEIAAVRPSRADVIAHRLARFARATRRSSDRSSLSSRHRVARQQTAVPRSPCPPSFGTSGPHIRQPGPRRAFCSPSRRRSCA